MRFAIGSPSDGRRGEHGHMSVVSKKRIHELAKDWNVSTKDVLAKIERLGIRNKKSQSSLSDDQIARVREALGLRDKALVASGPETAAVVDVEPAIDAIDVPFFAEEPAPEAAPSAPAPAVEEIAARAPEP